MIARPLSIVLGELPREPENPDVFHLPVGHPLFFPTVERNEAEEAFRLRLRTPSHNQLVNQTPLITPAAANKGLRQLLLPNLEETPFQAPREPEPLTRKWNDSLLLTPIDGLQPLEVLMYISQLSLFRQCLEYNRQKLESDEAKFQQLEALIRTQDPFSTEVDPQSWCYVPSVTNSSSSCTSNARSERDTTSRAGINTPGAGVWAGDEVSSPSSSFRSNVPVQNRNTTPFFGGFILGSNSSDEDDSSSLGSLYASSSSSSSPAFVPSSRRSNPGQLSRSASYQSLSDGEIGWDSSSVQAPGQNAQGQNAQFRAVREGLPPVAASSDNEGRAFCAANSRLSSKAGSKERVPSEASSDTESKVTNESYEYLSEEQKAPMPDGARRSMQDFRVSSGPDSESANQPIPGGEAVPSETSLPAQRLQDFAMEQPTTSVHGQPRALPILQLAARRTRSSSPSVLSSPSDQFRSLSAESRSPSGYASPSAHFGDAAGHQDGPPSRAPPMGLSRLRYGPEGAGFLGPGPALERAAAVARARNHSTPPRPDTAATVPASLAANQEATLSATAQMGTPQTRGAESTVARPSSPSGQGGDVDKDWVML